MSRLGRSQPIQPFVAHGFLGNIPANGVLPGQILVVENDDRRRKTPPLQPVIVNGAYAVVLAPTVLPPAPTVAAAPDRPRVSTAPPPVVEHGFVDSGVGVPGTTPPPPVSIDRVDQRVRFKPLDPVALNGLFASLTGLPPATPPAPINVDRADQRIRFRPLDPISISAALDSVTPLATPNPPAPFIVPLDERRRFLAALPPIIGQPQDDALPPQPGISEPLRPRDRYRTPDPTVVSGALGGVFQPVITPPAPYVVPLIERRRLLDALTYSHGFVDPGPGPVGDTPPPPLNLDRVDQRARYLPLPALAIQGTFVQGTITPPATGVNQDFASIIAGW